MGQSRIFYLQHDNQSDITIAKELAVGGESHEALIADINLQAAIEWREERISERRPHTYRFLIQK